MGEILAIVFAVFAALFAITGTMRSSIEYDNMDHHEIGQYNVKEMWFLVWDHREEYYAALGCLAVVLVSLVFS